MPGNDQYHIPTTHQVDMKAMMRKIVNPAVVSTWDDAWKVNVTPWDSGDIQPPLKELIEGNVDGIVWPKTGRALVPGCGAVI